MDFQLVVLRGRSSSKAVKLADSITTVGRQDDCQLRIASSQVSRKHCQLFEHKGHLLVKDLGSANGTYVNGQKIATQRVLEAGDELAIGPVKFRVEKRPGSGPQPRLPEPVVSSADTAVGPAAAAALADDSPILGTPVGGNQGPGGSSQEFDVELDETPIALGEDDDSFEIDFDEELPGAAPAPEPIRAATPTPPPADATAKATKVAKPEPEAKDEFEGEVGDDAVADFLMNLKIDDE